MLELPSYLMSIGPRYRMRDASAKTGNSVHLHPATLINKDTPNGWAENDMSAVDPDLGIMENSNHECSDSEEESATQEPWLAAVEPLALRLSACTNKYVLGNEHLPPINENVTSVSFVSVLNASKGPNSVSFS